MVTLGHEPHTEQTELSAPTAIDTQSDEAVFTAPFLCAASLPRSPTRVSWARLPAKLRALKSLSLSLPLRKTKQTETVTKQKGPQFTSIHVGIVT